MGCSGLYGCETLPLTLWTVLSKIFGPTRDNVCVVSLGYYTARRIYARTPLKIDHDCFTPHPSLFIIATHPTTFHSMLYNVNRWYITTCLRILKYCLPPFLRWRKLQKSVTIVGLMRPRFEPGTSRLRIGRVTAQFWWFFFPWRRVWAMLVPNCRCQLLIAIAEKNNRESWIAPPTCHRATPLNTFRCLPLMFILNAHHDMRVILQ
jgi:hypothetical protein